MGEVHVLEGEGPAGVGELARWPPGRAGSPHWVARVVRLAAGAALPSGSVAAPLDGPLEVRAADGARRRVARLDALALPEGGAELAAAARVLSVEHDRARVHPSIEAVRAGRRRWREEPGPGGHVLVLAVEGEHVARVSGEDEPFELLPGDALWLAEARAGEEVELSATGRDAAAVALVVRPGAGPDPVSAPVDRP